MTSYPQFLLLDHFVLYAGHGSHIVERQHRTGTARMEVLTEVHHDNDIAHPDNHWRVSLVHQGKITTNLHHVPLSEVSPLQAALANAILPNRWVHEGPRSMLVKEALRGWNNPQGEVHSFQHALGEIVMPSLWLRIDGQNHRVVSGFPTWKNGENEPYFVIETMFFPEGAEHPAFVQPLRFTPSEMHFLTDDECRADRRRLRDYERRTENAGALVNPAPPIRLSSNASHLHIPRQKQTSFGYRARHG